MPLSTFYYKVKKDDIPVIKQGKHLYEDIAYGQRIEKFDLYLKRPNGRYKKAYSGTIVGMKKIIKLRGKASGAILVIRQSRSNPIIKQIAFYD